MTTPLRTYEYPDGNRALYLEGPLTDAIAGEVLSRKINRLVVVRYGPWTTSRLPEIRTAINELWFQTPEAPLEAAEGFSNLRSFHVDRPAEAFDFSQFGALGECALANQRSIPESLKKCRRLEVLSLNNSKLKNLEGVEEIRALRKLVLGSVAVTSLAPVGGARKLRHFGVTRFQESDLSFLAPLRELETCYLSLGPKLMSLHGIEDAPVMDFMLAACAKVTDLRPLAQLATLRRLVLESCPNIETLRPLVRLENLATLLLWENTKIVDGDLRCLLTLPKLKELSFKDRKGYNLTLAEAKAALVRT